MLATVHAEAFADARIGSLSGGEQQRLRIGQALIGDSRLLLCDEPLISLDLNQQRSVSDLIDASRREPGRAVLMITHDVNPVLDMVDTVVYLANGKALVGSVDDVFTSEVLSEPLRHPGRGRPRPRPDRRRRPARPRPRGPRARPARGRERTLMHDAFASLWGQLFSFSNYGELLALVRNSIVAGAVLGLTGGLVGVFVMARDLAFAVHAISELSFAGAAAGLLFGVGVVEGSLAGSLAAALLIGVLGSRARNRNSIIAVLMPFGLGLGILCLSLYSGRAANKFGLLTGQIVAVDNPRLTALLVICGDRRRRACCSSGGR